MESLKIRCEADEMAQNVLNGTMTWENHFRRSLDNAVYLAFFTSSTEDPLAGPFLRIQQILDYLNDLLADTDFDDEDATNALNERTSRFYREVVTDLINIDRLDLVSRLYNASFPDRFFFEDALFEHYERLQPNFTQNFENDIQSMLYEAVREGRCDVVDILLAQEDVMRGNGIREMEARDQFVLDSFDTIQRVLTTIPEFFDQFEDFSIEIYDESIANIFGLANRQKKLSIYGIREFGNLDTFFRIFPLQDYLNDHWTSISDSDLPLFLASLEANPTVVVPYNTIYQRILRMEHIDVLRNFETIEFLINRDYRAESEILNLDRILRGIVYRVNEEDRPVFLPGDIRPIWM